MRQSRILALLAFSLATLAVAASFRGSNGIRQPIRFDHSRHVQEGLACLDCHKNAESSRYATLPRISTCRLCHEEAKGDSADEKVVREHLERQEEIPWIQVNRMPGHVYFTHAMHVKAGKLECAVCHGDMAKATEPVERSQVDGLTMRACMRCHVLRGASNDCLACHE